MELLDKLNILADAAKYDAACTSSGLDRSGRPGTIGSTTLAGCCHSFSADGRCISLLKVLQTNVCVYDCQYCVNRCSNDTRRTAFSPEERCELLRRSAEGLPNVEIKMFSGLLADYAAQQGAGTIIKGLRAVSDFEYEFQMALANRKLNPDLDTVFLMTSAEHMYLSSSIVKDIAAHGGDISGFVPDSVKDDILLRIRKDGNEWQR